jgi:hypothetical protein
MFPFLVELRNCFGWYCVNQTGKGSPLSGYIAITPHGRLSALRVFLRSWGKGLSRGGLENLGMGLYKN